MTATLPLDAPPGATADHIIVEVLDATGDTKAMWDRTNPDEVAAAKAQFQDLVGNKKFAAFKATGERGDRGEPLREFDPAVERVIYVPPMRGG